MHSRVLVAACLSLAIGCTDKVPEEPPVSCGPENPCPEGLICRTSVGQSSCVDEDSARITKRFPISGYLPPYAMLVIDRSGSMNDPAFSGSPTSKWGDVVSALTDSETGILYASRHVARWGLTLFPGIEGGCAPGRVDVRLALYLDNADVVASRLQRVAVAGGTPTALSLAAAAEDPRLSEPENPGRARAVVLLTDGLPNCNPSAENASRCDACNADASTCGEVTGCQPTFGISATECDLYAAPKGSDCLDDQGLVQAIEELRSSGVDTFVVGYGDALGEVGDRVLDAAADAGGRALEGTGPKYYKAANRDELHAALGAIAGPVYLRPPCVFSLDPAPANDDLRVALHSISSTATILEKDREWRFRKTGSFAEIEVIGETCDALHGTSPNRLELSVRYLPVE